MRNKVVTHTVSRRRFMQSSAALATAGTLSGLSLPVRPLMAQTLTNNSIAEEIKYSACLVNCGSRCPLKVHVKAGIATKISSEDGVNEAIFGQHQIRPCLRGRSARWRVYNHDRLKYPMKRVGRRGEGKFERISWEEAIQTIAKQLKYTIEKYGNEAIYYQYGSGSTGANLQGRNACKRLLSLAGGFLDMHGTYSTAQINTVFPYVYGNDASKDGSLFAEVAHADLVVMFGQNIAETRMSGGGQIAEFMHALSQSKAKVIIIDPRRTDSVTLFNADWVPIYPGTDAALVAAMAYVLHTEGRLDERMLKQYVTGWSEESLPEDAPTHASYQSYIMGLGTDGIAKTPEWASRITGIPATRIKQLAHEIINANSAWISQGWGIQRTIAGENNARSVMLLPILTGHFGRPGTNIGTWGGSVTYAVPGLSIPNPVKTKIPTFLWTEAILRGTEMTAIQHGVQGKEKLEVGIKFLWNYASNITGNQHSDLNKTHQILQDESLCEFILVWDNHMTASARYADILLPDVTTLESDDLINNSYASGAYHYVVRTEKTIEPLWENRHTYDVLTDMAAHLGLKEAFTEGRSYQDWLRYSYEQLKNDQPHIPEFDQAKGIVDRQLADSREHIALKDFRADPVAHPLATPSGKVEFYSAALANLSVTWLLDSQDHMPAIPEYRSTLEGVDDQEKRQRYPLQMIGFHTKGHTHSTYPTVPQLMEAVPDRVWLNPIDAQRYGIVNDNQIEIFNDRGRIHMRARVTPRMMPGVIAVPQGAWAKTNTEGVDIGGCINRLTMLRPSPLAKGNPQHTNLVEIKKV